MEKEKQNCSCVTLHVKFVLGLKNLEREKGGNTYWVYTINREQCFMAYTLQI